MEPVAPLRGRYACSVPCSCQQARRGSASSRCGCRPCRARLCAASRRRHPPTAAAPRGRVGLPALRAGDGAPPRTHPGALPPACLPREADEGDARVHPKRRSRFRTPATRRTWLAGSSVVAHAAVVSGWIHLARCRCMAGTIWLAGTTFLAGTIWLSRWTCVPSSLCGSVWARLAGGS